jgi:hypothetical protein
MAEIRSRLKRLTAAAAALPHLAADREARGARERLLLRLRGMAERMPERRAEWDALSPEEREAQVAYIRQALVDRLRCLGLRV